jgi:hypothetical protein
MMKLIRRMCTDSGQLQLTILYLHRTVQFQLFLIRIRVKGMNTAIRAQILVRVNFIRFVTIPSSIRSYNSSYNITAMQLLMEN